MSQRDETTEKLSQLKEQLGSNGGSASELLNGGDDTDESDASDTAESNSADLGEIGESLGQSLGGLVGRRLGEAIGREIDLDERMVTLLTSYLETTDLEGAAESLVSTTDDGDTSDTTGEDDESGSSEPPDDFDEMSTDELQSQADQLMGELEERSEDG